MSTKMAMGPVRSWWCALHGVRGREEPRNKLHTFPEHRGVIAYARLHLPAVGGGMRASFPGHVLGATLSHACLDQRLGLGVVGTHGWGTWCISTY